MSRSRLIAIIVVLAALVFGVAAWRAASRPAPLAAAAPPRAPADTLRYPPGAEQLSFLDIEPAAEFPAPALDALPGKLAFDEDRTVRVASPVQGRVSELVAKPGTAVKAGDVLAWLDSPDFAQARADARKAQADHALKRKALERARALTDLGVLARKDLESAEDDLAQAGAELERADAVLKNLDPSGASPRYALRAPIAGIVVDRAINPGMQVRPDASAPLFVITDPTRLWVSFELAEQDLGKVRVGQAVRVEVDGFADRSFEGRVTTIGAALDPATRRIAVRVELLDGDARLKPELFARVSPLADGGSRQVAVPNSALVSVGLHHYAFVEEAPGVLKRRALELGVVGEQRAFVRSGLAAGERVVTRGALLLDAELGQAE
ncbi:efflux RND transporter periplasmic adaptor subunit [Dokdonella sp.]|uniref:efflux RND transporter periplasmic adaptor subunit n=1 Tax=Dokdonella sp. TaxID=2291710 RepID=UPI001B137E9D|nr:efflux RND transporter periplasmic adaptor subunit [Dokdonella sp.]MBO9661545.1 efflux RND transporter periplasmic adaptor subunit [Dokdonella sp.]